MATKEQSKALIRHDFSREEIAELGEQIAKLQMEAARLEEQKKAATSHYASEINKAKIEIGTATRKIHDGYELREELCDVQRDFDLGIVYFFHNGELVKERRMTADEKQRGLPFSDATRAAAADLVNTFEEGDSIEVDGKKLVKRGNRMVREDAA